MVRHPDDDLRGAEAFSEHYSISERDTAEEAMQDAARRALSMYCSLFSGVADGLDLKYYPHHLTDSAGGVIVSPVGEGNPRLNSMVNLATVLNTELDHALDELGKVRAEVAELCAECVPYYIISADGGSIYLTETSLADAFSKTIEELTVTEDTESTETVENTDKLFQSFADDRMAHGWFPYGC